METRTIKALIHDAQCRVYAMENNLLADIWNHLIKPFCDKHGCRFSAGNGVWGFDLPEADAYNEHHLEYGVRWHGKFNDPDKGSAEWKALCNFLFDQFEWRQCDIGCLCDDYTPEGFEERLVEARNRLA